MVLSKFWNILGSGTSHQNICAVTFAIVWWIFTQISIGIHKRFRHADFANLSWSYDFAMLTNRKLLGIESDFFAGCASYITSAAKTWNVSGKFQTLQEYWKIVSIFGSVGKHSEFLPEMFHPFVTLSIATLLTIHKGPSCLPNWAEIKHSRRFWNLTGLCRIVRKLCVKIFHTFATL